MARHNSGESSAKGDRCRCHRRSKLVNAAAERIGGWRPGELTGLDLSEVYWPAGPSKRPPVEVPSLPLAS